MNKQKLLAHVGLGKNSIVQKNYEQNGNSVNIRKKQVNNRVQLKIGTNIPRISKQQIIKKQKRIKNQQKISTEISIQDYSTYGLQNNDSREQYYDTHFTQTQKNIIQHTKKQRKSRKQSNSHSKEHSIQFPSRKKHSQRNIEKIAPFIQNQDNKRPTKSTSLRKMRKIQRNGVIDANGNIIPYARPSFKVKKRPYQQNDSRSDNSQNMITHLYYSRQHVKHETKRGKLLTKPKSDKKITLNYLNSQKKLKKTQIKRQAPKNKNITKKAIQKAVTSNYGKIYLEQQTEVTPSHQHISNITNYQLNQVVDFDVVNEQIKMYLQKQQSRRKQELQEQQKKRMLQGLAKISKLSDQLFGTNQIYFLACICFTSFFIGKSLNSKNPQIAGAASLLIAIKMQDPYRFQQYQELFKPNAKRKEKTRQAASIQKGTQSNKSKSKEKKNLKNSKQKIEKNLNQPQQQNSLFKEIIQCEFEIMKQSKFHINFFTVFSVVQTLTATWDQFIKRQYQQIHKIYGVYLFRYPGKNNKYKILLQIIHLYYLQSSIFPEKTNSSDDVQVIISVMYLLLRISLELKGREPDSWKILIEKYRKSLSESTNIIFIDSVGINQLFGNFIKIFQLNYGVLISSFSFVGKYLNSQIFNYDNQDNSLNAINNSIYTHNQKIYNYVKKNIEANQKQK